MKTIKVLILTLFVFFLAGELSAQNAKTAPAKTATKIEKTASKTKTKAAVKTKKKVADGRTKTGDKVYHDKKGPHGETVYIGPRGGFYYLDKKENKVYIK